MAVSESARRSSIQSPHSHPWLAEVIFAFDAWLRHRLGVMEYTTHPRCVFRLHIGAAHRELALRDGTLLHRGERIACLHFWNEQIPPVPDSGTTIRWARQMQRGIAVSLRELAKYFDAHTDCDDIAVICADVPCGTQSQAQQLANIMGYYGFEAIAEEEPAPTSERLHRFGENILISLVVLAQNSATLRHDTLRRVRVPIYLSRRGLGERFGGDCAAAGEAREVV